MSDGYLPDVGSDIFICATVVYHAGQIGADGKTDLYVVEFANGDHRTLKVVDTTQTSTFVFAE
jgi:hypothetical protein